MIGAEFITGGVDQGGIQAADLAAWPHADGSFSRRKRELRTERRPRVSLRTTVTLKLTGVILNMTGVILRMTKVMFNMTAGASE
jgi:hypothetical protein